MVTFIRIITHIGIRNTREVSRVSVIPNSHAGPVDDPAEKITQ